SALAVNFTVGGTATFNSDYTQTGASSFFFNSGIVNFAAGSSTATVTIDPTTDTVVEPDETVILTVAPGTGYGVGSPSAATGTIVNDDTEVTVAVSPTSVQEDGATNLVYTFTRNGVTTGALTANFSVGGTATFNTDYTQSGAATFGANSGTVTFAAGATTATVTIDPTADTVVEPDETVTLTVTSGAGYNTANPNVAIGTIMNDDADVSVAVSPAAVPEDGAANLVYTFTRNGYTGAPLTVSFAVAGTATLNSDYTQSGAASFSAANGTVTFAAGSSTATVTIDPTADSVVEPDETVILTVAPASGYGIATPSAATGTITNDDTDVSVAVSPASVLEDGATNLVYTFTRNGVTTGALTANFTVGGTATFNSDYSQSGAATFSATNGTVTFAAGSSTATVTIDPTPDNVVEPSETVILTVASGSGYGVGSPNAATGTITNDDTDVSVAVSPATVLEDGPTNLVYTFTRGGDITGALTANFTVGGTATFNSDYTQTGAATFSATSGTVTFAAGSATATVTIDPTVDTVVEPDETVILTVTSGSGYSVGASNAATGTIVNDDQAPLFGSTAVSVAVSPASVPEDGAANLVYTFTRNGDPTAALTANFTVGGTATFNSDYTQSGAATFSATSGTVTFAAGATTATVTIDPTADTVVEPDETVILTVTSGADYGVGSPAAATGTIVNDDGNLGGTLQFSSATYNTTESSFFATITVQRTGDTTGAVSVDYATPDDSAATSVLPCSVITGVASPRCDFTPAVGTLHWAAGDNAAKTFTVLISQDNYVEGPEGLALTLSNPGGGAQLGSRSTATLTIADDANEPAQNPIDDPSDFVRQHYHDFLNREPDQSGFDFWVGNFPPCNGDPQCIEVKRVNVSAAFYLSIEFQGTGYFVERLYKSAYGDATGTSTDGGPHQLAVPIVKFSELLPDTQEIGRGVVVLAPGWEAALEANKVAFTQEFVQRPRFVSAYPLSMTPAQFVDALNNNAGKPLSTAERDQLVSDLTGGVKTRAQVLRAVADDQDLINAEFNRAFVLMQYFGFLRRNPDAAPDIDHTGYDFWLKKLNSFNGDFVQAEMVKAFLSSLEYRRRSGSN
ncbi:MAG TPA: Calx-beta domain-containing protein, partial [Pyrinomonadaceae bacterium]|nr:Calx-beta domain-containing protein [Pyrinomonadaceae bacterium]